MTIFDLIKQYLRYDNVGMTVTRKGLVAYVQANAKQAKMPCSVNTIDTYCRMLRKIDILHSTNVPGIYAYQASKQLDKRLASLTSTQLYDKAYGEDAIWTRTIPVDWKAEGEQLAQSVWYVDKKTGAARHLMPRGQNLSTDDITKLLQYDIHMIEVRL
jgi:hypothetical protein